MSRCVQITSAGFVVDMDPQPANKSECSYLLSSADQSALFEIPSGEDLAEPFGFAFSLIMVCGLVGFFIGRIVNFWR